MIFRKKTRILSISSHMFLGEGISCGNNKLNYCCPISPDNTLHNCSAFYEAGKTALESTVELWDRVNFVNNSELFCRCFSF